MRILADELFEQTFTDPFAMPNSLVIDQPFCKGVITKLAVKEGVWVISTDVSFSEDTCIVTPNQDKLGCVWMSVCLSGDVFLSKQNRAFHLKAGHSNVHVDGQSEKFLTEDIKKNTCYQTVSVMMSQDAFRIITTRQPSEIYQLSELEFSGRRRMAPPAMLKVAEQILKTEFKGVDKKLFLEAKILELVAYKLGILDQYNPARKNSISAPPSLAEKIHYAAELLEQMMPDPPGIFKLSRKVGLDHTVLIRGFKEIYGHTPFEYLSKIRLQKAAELIASGEQNVTEAAFNVGYANLSHFAKIFRKEFGMNPKAYSMLRMASNKSIP